MQARLDSFVPPLCCASLIGPARANCCGRCADRVDDAPALAALLVDAAETAVAFVQRNGLSMLRDAAITRQ